ncbi:hypothetical protein CAEBREN_18567 [Caenorhabditis brenneri]|uniref:SPK domain-containing protein n=1 Tax=Caenorhabditis brenneri TaxID=135651 RepID=G0NSY2_CAEBE|nr:hypothetical protein CAEBREN_18567 [Caenorhabditis brenneri]
MSGRNSTRNNPTNGTGRSDKWEDALMKFLLDKVSDCTEFRCMTTLCKDFNIEYPQHAAKRSTINSRIRVLLKQIDHKEYDVDTLARLMFCLAQPLIGKNLGKVENRLRKSGNLRLDDKKRIILYRNEEVHFKGVHTGRNQQIRLREERARRESEARMRREEADMEFGSNEEEYDPMEADEDEVEDETLAPPSTGPSTSTRMAPVGQSEHPVVHNQLLEDERQVSLTAPHPFASLVPVPLENQTRTFNYYSLLKNIHNYILVLEDPTFELLRTEIVEELGKPGASDLKITGTQIAETLAYGIRIVVNNAKQNINPSSKPIQLIETLRFWKLLLLNVGFPKDDESVTKITSLISDFSPEMMIPVAKLRFALESIFENVRQ